MANYQGGFDSDYDFDQLVGYESEQEFDQASEMMNNGEHNYKGNLKSEIEQVESETESGSDEFDACGYFVGKKIRPGVYEFDDASESESSSYESDVTSKPCKLRDELNEVESRITCYDDDDDDDDDDVTSDVPVGCSCKRDFPAGCGVGALNLIDDGNLATVSRLESDSIKTRNVSFKRDFPVGCGTSSVPCFKKRKVSAKRDCSPVGCQSIESVIYYEEDCLG